jgi:ATP-dependent Clp protease ATP-binding subunit ClpA
MILDSSDARFEQSRARLQPYAREVLERTARHALRLNADVVTAEHLLSTLMADPASAACALVLHAFADPQTIAGEALAISPGVMVVGSGATLPFSPLGLRALIAARALARERRESEVDDLHLTIESAAAIGSESLAALRAAGFDSERLRSEPALASDSPAPDSGPLFKHFSLRAKRALTQANHMASALRLEAISPAHVLLGTLKESERSSSLGGLSFQRARLVLAGRTADETEPAPRALPPDESLIEFVERLPDRAGSLALLAQFLAGDTPELAQILLRNKVTAELIERARGSFDDPAQQEV